MRGRSGDYRGCEGRDEYRLEEENSRRTHEQSVLGPRRIDEYPHAVAGLEVANPFGAQHVALAGVIAPAVAVTIRDIPARAAVDLDTAAMNVDDAGGDFLAVLEQALLAPT